MKYLASDQLDAFLGYLAGDALVVAPVKDEGGVLLYRPWAPGTAVELDVLLAKQSAKEFIFRQSETYLKYSYTMQGEAAAVAENPEAAHAEAEGEPDAAAVAAGPGRDGHRRGDAHRRGDERGAGSGDLRRAALRRARLRPDGQRVRRVWRLLLRSLLQRQAGGHHAARAGVPRPPLHVLLYERGRQPGGYRGCRRRLHPGGGWLHR